MKTHTAILNAALVACLMAGGSFVYAGDDTKEATTEDQTANSVATADPSTIEGKTVLDESGQELGDVDEVVHGQNGEQLAVIGLDDSLREVAVPLDKLEWSSDGANFVTMLNRAELEAMPDYDPMDLEEVDE